jgi:hypothetical protein
LLKRQSILDVHHIILAPDLRHLCAGERSLTSATVWPSACKATATSRIVWIVRPGRLSYAAGHCLPSSMIPKTCPSYSYSQIMGSAFGIPAASAAAFMAFMPRKQMSTLARTIGGSLLMMASLRSDIACPHRLAMSGLTNSTSRSTPHALSISRDARSNAAKAISHSMLSRDDDGCSTGSCFFLRSGRLFGPAIFAPDCCPALFR